VGSKAIAEETLLWPLLFELAVMRTVVYIDGFNLYYRMLKARPSMKWLNPLLLTREMLNAEHDVTRVNYYIARVSSRAHDPHAPARQAVYLNALGTVPEIAVHEGSFMISEPWMPLAQPPQAKPSDYQWNQPAPNVVRVVKSEEKGSDVNLGVHLVRDAFIDAFDVAIVITNDSDLVEAIRIAIHEAGKRVGLFVPVKYPTQSLINVASFYLHIRPGHLAKSQFPSAIQLENGGTISKPETWI
jgi:uncharacterized LabA/DUF88 family protein